MEKGTVTVIFKMVNRNKAVDLEVPINMSANELVSALNTAYGLGIDVTDVKKCYLTLENPIAYLHGNRTLKEFGVHNGSTVVFAD